MTIQYIDDSLSEQKLHARYLLTEKGGLRYDKGFRPGKPPTYVDITLLDTTMHKSLYDRFSDSGKNDYKVEMEYRWNATGS